MQHACPQLAEKEVEKDSLVNQLNDLVSSIQYIPNWYWCCTLVHLILHACNPLVP
jgi:hypothetical protein